MKKTLSALLLVIALLAMLVLPASAATGSLSTKATLQSDGTSFTVDLLVKDNPGIIAVTGMVTYNSKVIKLKSAENGEIFDNVFMSSQTLAVNPYQMIWMDATASEDITENGVLARYTFEVLKDAPIGESEIKFEITETVNYAKDSTSKIKACTFKFKVGGTVGDNAFSAVDPNVQGNANGDENLNVQKPIINTSDVEAPSSDIQINADAENTSSNSSDVMGDEHQENDHTLITIITILAVVVLGLGITFTALYFRKKAAIQKNEE